MSRIDFDAIADDYDHGRHLHDHALTDWQAALSAWLPAPAEGPLLDLGAGTGQFSGLLSEWFGVDVVAVEPSTGMRRHASASPGVRLLGGRAETVPLRDASCSAAWLSAVVHHFAAIDMVARELSRVVRANGVVLIREAFPGRMDGTSLQTYFPDAVRYIDDTYPLADDVVAGFERVGFTYELLMSVPQQTARNLTEALERVQRRADTTLRSISDEAFEAGLARLRQAAVSQPPAPVVDHLDLLVLRRT